MCKQADPAERKSKSKTRSSTAPYKKPINKGMLNESISNSNQSRSTPQKKSSRVISERRSRSKSRSSTPKKLDVGVNPAAFRGAPFDKQGHCINHPKVKLANPIIGPDGKTIYQDLKASCRFCQSAKHRKKCGTSLSGGKVQERPRRPSMSGKKSMRCRSLSIERRKEKPVYSTPFDEKGRCHYHKNVQLAGKKITGGWKVVFSICPRCMEDDNSDEEASVRSSKSNRSSWSGLSRVCSGNAHGRYDRKGRCVLHSHIQVAKKKTFGHGWKVLRVCPACDGSEKNSKDDALSVSSRSTVSSRKSIRSVTSASSRGKKVSSGRFGTLPFDGEGYCFQHPSIMMAQKKMMGGFKIIMDVCPECAIDRGIESNKKKSARRKSGTGHDSDQTAHQRYQKYREAVQSEEKGL